MNHPSDLTAAPHAAARTGEKRKDFPADVKDCDRSFTSTRDNSDLRPILPGDVKIMQDSFTSAKN
jgi:hypothetical protein